jgi:hypothetical protein
MAAMGAACGARTNQSSATDAGTSSSSGGSDSGSGSGGTSSGSGSGVVDVGVDAGPSSFTGGQVQTALARCSLAHGAASNVTNQTEEQQNLVGSWLLCPASDDAGPPTMFAPGIRFASDGTFETFGGDADGGVVVAPGVQTQGQWSTSCETSSSITGSQPCAGNIVVHLQTVGGNTSPAGCFGGAISFEASPRRMYVVDSPAEWCDVQYAGGDFDLWLVAVP